MKTRLNVKCPNIVRKRYSQFHAISSFEPISSLVSLTEGYVLKGGRSCLMPLFRHYCISALSAPQNCINIIFHVYPTICSSLIHSCALALKYHLSRFLYGYFIMCNISQKKSPPGHVTDALPFPAIVDMFSGGVGFPTQTLPTFPR